MSVPLLNQFGQAFGAVGVEAAEFGFLLVRDQGRWGPARRRFRCALDPLRDRGGRPVFFQCRTKQT